MKTLRNIIGAACAVVLGALITTSVAQAAITGTPHDLRGLTTLGATAELCAFCHTPHNGDAAPPLWNRDPSVSLPSFTPYNSSTMDAATGQPSGVSAGCLSCHDGATAYDALQNPANITLTTPGQVMPVASTKNLGTILSNDHPVSIQYGTAAGSGDLDFLAPTVSGSKVYLTAGTTEIPLYPGTPGTVECGSCHDPHDNTNTNYQRVVNTGSQLCFACHNK